MAFTAKAENPPSSLPAEKTALLASGAAQAWAKDTANLSQTLKDLEKYAEVEAAAASGFLGGDLLLLLQDHEKLRFSRLQQPRQRPSALPPLPFRISTAAIPLEGQGDRMLVGRDDGGDEEFQLYAYAPLLGKLDLWPMPPGRATGMRFAPGGRSFIYAHNPAIGSQWDIRLGHFRSPSPAESDSVDDELIFRQPGIWFPLDVDSGGENILLMRIVSSFHSELYHLRRKASDSLPAAWKDLTRLPPTENHATISWAQWLPAGKGPGEIALIADGPNEFPSLYRLKPGDSLRAVSPPCSCEVEAAAVLPGTRKIVYSLNRQSVSQLQVADLDSGWVKPIGNLPRATLSHLQADEKGRRILLVMTGFDTPGDLYVYDWQNQVTRLWMRAPGIERLPKAEFPALPPQRLQVPPALPLPPPQTTLPLWLLTPQSVRYPSPVLLSIHGGPEMQARPGWDPLSRYLLEQWGMAIAYPDLRGSAGYGRAYLAADDQRRRTKVMSDLGCILDTLTRLSKLHPRKMAVTGRSYGGFVSQAALLDFAENLQAAISTVGISDFPAFLRETSAYRRDLRRMEYGDERDSAQLAFLDSISPLRRMPELKRPLLWIHGKNDPRVPFSQSRKAYDILADRRAPALLLAEQEEGHGTRNPATRLEQMRVSALFLIHALKLRRP